MFKDIIDSLGGTPAILGAIIVAITTLLWNLFKHRIKQNVQERDQERNKEKLFYEEIENEYMSIIKKLLAIVTNHYYSVTNRKTPVELHKTFEELKEIEKYGELLELRAMRIDTHTWIIDHCFDMKELLDEYSKCVIELEKAKNEDCDGDSMRSYKRNLYRAYLKINDKVGNDLSELATGINRD